MGERKQKSDNQGKVTPIKKFKNSAKSATENVSDGAAHAWNGVTDRFNGLGDIIKNINKSDEKIAQEDVNKIKEVTNILNSEASEENKKHALKRIMNNDLVDKVMRHAKQVTLFGLLVYLTRLAILKKL